MKNKMMTAAVKQIATWFFVCVGAFSLIGNYAYAALTTLADEPAAAGVFAPPNVMLDLSVEFPTGVVAAYNDNPATFPYVDPSGTSRSESCPGRDDQNHGICYFSKVTYVGYFDPYKCYEYNRSILSSTTDGTSGAFVPAGATDALHQCPGKWSGNFLNWAATQAIDGFREVMTGGNRSVDTTTTTILEKARATGQGGFSRYPIKRVGGPNFTDGGVTVTPVNPGRVTPYLGTQSLFSRVHTGSVALPDPSGSPAGSGGFMIQVSSNKNFPSYSSQNPSEFTDTYYVRIKVCDSSAPPGFGTSSGLEANCASYGSTYKPIGLIQEKSQAMRFGVFSYLLDSAKERAGGVMRARMKDTGPQKLIPGTGLVNNPKVEWSTANGILLNNPEPVDAMSSGVNNSGVINYLNKFGRANAYKYYDTPAEMYYESLKYLRNMSSTPEYSSGMVSDMKDAFPVIVSNWDDPIQYSCQKNFIVFIGDSAINCDSLVPGNVLNDTCGGHSGVPSTSDPAINVRDLDNQVGAMEGMGRLGEVFFPVNDPSWPVPADYPAGRKATYNISGLAYWAHTHDIRPDDANKPQTKNKQTVTSFFIDVLEDGSPGGKNIYWLGAKYGGFDDINNDGKPANNATWDKNSDGIPDNFFTGNRPDDLSKSLRNIFDAITGVLGAGTGVGLSNPNFDTTSSGNSAYQTSFKTGEWSGDVEGGALSVNELISGGKSTFTATFTKSWSAQALLDAQVLGNGWDPKRKIATRSNGSGVSFRLASLTAVQQAALGATAAARKDMLEYLRGKKTMEGNGFRPRLHILGDIVHSRPAPVAAPNATYQDYVNANYSAFKTSNASRKKMVYVGANDGMLHAFNGETDLTKDPNGGMEVWAYVPSFVITGPSGTPAVDGLAAYASPAKPYVHHFYVDQTPEVRDVNFSKTDGSTSSTANWRTLLVGGLGKGGKGYYALDVTDGATAVNENTVAAKVLWEFTDQDMGFSYGRPVIVKTVRYGWVVLLTSGYNNVSGSRPGQGFLYVVNARTGALIKKIGTGVGSGTSPSGLARGTAYIQNFDDFTVDQFYVGDLLGNLWRFDLRAPDGNYPAPNRFAVLTDPTGNPQPISVGPRIEISRNKRDRWVFVGTGKDLASIDGADGQQQTMYAIRDGSKDAPATVIPLKRSDFAVVTDLTKGVSVPDKGWLYDLTGGNARTGRERVTIDPDANQGVVVFSGNVASNDPCAGGGVGRAYAVEFDTGLSVLSNGAGSVRSFIDGATVVGASLVTINHKLSIAITDSSGNTKIPNDGLLKPRGGSSAAIMNWREILE